MKQAGTKKIIWLVTELFYPEEDATAYIFTQIANHFTEAYEVNVICGPASYDGSYKKISGEIGLKESINVFRNNTITLDKNNIIQRTFRLLLLSFQLLNTLRKKAAKNDIVFIATNPAPLLLFIGFLKYFKAFQLHILIHDVFPENTIPAGLFKKNTNIIYRLFALIFNHAYCQADHLITLGRDMEELLLNKIAKKKKDITVSVIPNWGDTKTIMPQNRQDSLITKWGLQDKIILQYAGNIGRVQALPEVIDAFYQNSNTKLHLVIFGSGAYTRNIIQFINKNDVKNITYYGSFLRHEQNEILNSCDIAIVSLSKGMYGLGVPSKAYNILAAGKPILFIGECNSEIAQLVAEEKIGWTIDINKNNALIDFFSNLKLDNPDELLAMGLRARQLCEEKYTKNKILSDLLNSVNNINSK